MKIKYFLSLSVVAILTAGCSQITPSIWSKLKNDEYAMNYQSPLFKNYDTTFDTQSFKDACNGMVAYATTSDIKSFDQCIRYVFDSYYKLYSCLFIAETRYYGDSSDLVSKKQYEDYVDLTRLYSTSYSTSAQLAYTVGDEAFKKYFYGNMTDEEIEEYLSRYKYDEKTSAADKKISGIEDTIQLALNSFNKGEITIEEFEEIYYSNYYDLIVTGNDLATYKGYPNYLDYLYKGSFGRDYSYESSNVYAGYVKKHLIPAYNNMPIMPLDNPEFSTYFKSANLANNYFDFTFYLDGLADYMGGSYFSDYKHIFNDGYFYFSNSENSIGTAYCCWLPEEDEYLLFFSKNYQNILGICHEFGHTTALMSNSSNNGYCMDIKETHSTANEFLYMQYLLNKLPSSDMHYVDVKNSIYNNVRSEVLSIIAIALISEVEYKAYTTENLTKEKLKEMINETRGEYPNISSTYLGYATAASAGYYISYGTSGLAALQINNVLKSDLDKGANMYKQLLSYKGEDTSVETIWGSVGISSPFKEQTYIDLVNKLNCYYC